MRNISEEKLKEVVENPDLVEFGRNKKLIVSNTINQEKITVVYVVEGNAMVVITVI